MRPPLLRRHRAGQLHRCSESRPTSSVSGGQQFHGADPFSDLWEPDAMKGKRLAEDSLVECGVMTDHHGSVQESSDGWSDGR